MANNKHNWEESNFEITSKRRKGFPSETQVKRGVRVVHGEKELEERLGRNDLCPCRSGRRFKTCCRNSGRFRRREPGPLLLGNEARPPDPQTGRFISRRQGR